MFQHPFEHHFQNAFLSSIFPIDAFQVYACILCVMLICFRFFILQMQDNSPIDLLVAVETRTNFNAAFDKTCKCLIFNEC